MKNISFGDNDISKVVAKQDVQEKKVKKEEKEFTPKDKASAIEKLGKEQSNLVKIAEELYSKYPTNELYSAINSMEEILRKFEAIAEKVESFGG